MAGVLGILIFGRRAYVADPTGITAHLGSVGSLLAAPAVRWDGIWYLRIAHEGYHAAANTAFFPLYPMLIRTLSLLTGSYIVAAILISLAALLAALAIIHRLTALELGSEAAGAATTLLAFAPMAVFFSAVYTESLFLALSAGAFYAARRSRWAWAGALGGLAAATHSTGIVLAVPLAILYLYGPTEDRMPRSRSSRWHPRYRLDVSILWLLLIPAATAAFITYLATQGFGPSISLHAEEIFWGRHLIGPTSGIGEGLRAAFDQLRGTASGYESQGLAQLAALGLAGAALVATIKRLPLAYGVYSAATLLIAVSTNALQTGLVSFDRYASVVFPLYMAAGAWAVERRVATKLVLAGCVPLIIFAAEFSRWTFVA